MVPRFRVRVRECVCMHTRAGCMLCVRVVNAPSERQCVAKTTPPPRPLSSPIQNHPPPLSAPDLVRIPAAIQHTASSPLPYLAFPSQLVAPLGTPPGTPGAAALAGEAPSPSRDSSRTMMAKVPQSGGEDRRLATLRSGCSAQRCALPAHPGPLLSDHRSRCSRMPAHPDPLHHHEVPRIWWHRPADDFSAPSPARTASRACPARPS